MLLAERDEKIRERDSALDERVPPLKLSGMSVQELQDLCKDLHRKCDAVDEARYDLEVKVLKNEKEIENLSKKIDELKGTSMNRTKLKRVKKSTDAMLGALTESKLMAKSDFKANLKTVKKEEEKKEEVTDWRKNVEAMSGMEGRKKLFDAGHCFICQAKPKPKITASRRLFLKIQILKKASSLLATEKEEKKQDREDTLNERLPPLKLSGLSVQDLQNLCKEMHQKTDVIDEERYDLNLKVSKNDKEIENLSQKIFELKGKMKRPALKRVKISADAMLGALFGAKVKESVDFKANLKTVKKEEEKKEEVTDWRKNVEAMSGMEGRKKLFDAGQ
ncbi:troponin I, slow skeletal muscle-like [Sardina pilchardus]|uniref:troponin I, slow skeletal muscle-like n=1 Tax=Sardina pilchardus TaxID=27697 RepID=UPI002E0E1D0B